MLLFSEKLITCCAAGTNGCRDLRRRATALDGRVSAEWSRCPGSMARRPRDSVAPLRRSSAGWMPARVRRLSAGRTQASSHNLQGFVDGGYEHCGTNQARSALQSMSCVNRVTCLRPNARAGSPPDTEENRMRKESWSKKRIQEKIASSAPFHKIKK